MRQIGEDLRWDPHEIKNMVDAPKADMNDSENAAIYTHFTWNKYTEMSHKFCSRRLDFTNGTTTEQEGNMFKTCLAKYG